MKPRIILVLLLGITLAAVGQNQQETSVQIMTYNVRHCAGMDMVLDYDRTAAVISVQNPDLVALQELDSMTGRSGQRYQLGELGIIQSLEALSTMMEANMASAASPESTL